MQIFVMIVSLKFEQIIMQSFTLTVSEWMMKSVKFCMGVMLEQLIDLSKFKT